MNGYISIDFNGTAIGLKFGFPAVKEFILAATVKKELYFSGKELSGIGMAKLFHCGYKNWCELKEIDPVITLEQFSDWVDESEEKPERIDQMRDIIKVYLDSRYTKKLAAFSEEVEDDKKKETA